MEHKTSICLLIVMAITIVSGKWISPWGPIIVEESLHCDIHVKPGVDYVYDVTINKYILAEGNELQLLCDVTCLGSIKSRADIQWYGNDDRPVAQSTEGRYSLLRYGANHLYLRIEMVTVRDSGRYTCRGKINGDMRKASTYVKVETKPDFIPFVITTEKKTALTTPTDTTSLSTTTTTKKTSITITIDTESNTTDNMSTVSDTTATTSDTTSTNADTTLTTSDTTSTTAATTSSTLTSTDRPSTSSSTLTSTDRPSTSSDTPLATSDTTTKTTYKTPTNSATSSTTYTTTTIDTTLTTSDNTPITSNSTSLLADIASSTTGATTHISNLTDTTSSTKNMNGTTIAVTSASRMTPIEDLVSTVSINSTSDQTMFKNALQILEKSINNTRKGNYKPRSTTIDSETQKINPIHTSNDTNDKITARIKSMNITQGNTTVVRDIITDETHLDKDNTIIKPTHNITSTTPKRIAINLNGTRYTSIPETKKSIDTSQSNVSAVIIQKTNIVSKNERTTATHKPFGTTQIIIDIETVNSSRIYDEANPNINFTSGPASRRATNLPFVTSQRDVAPHVGSEQTTIISNILPTNKTQTYTSSYNTDSITERSVRSKQEQHSIHTHNFRVAGNNMNNVKKYFTKAANANKNTGITDIILDKIYGKQSKGIETRNAKTSTPSGPNTNHRHTKGGFMYSKSVEISDSQTMQSNVFMTSTNRHENLGKSTPAEYIDPHVMSGADATDIPLLGSVTTSYHPKQAFPVSLGDVKNVRNSVNNVMNTNKYRSDKPRKLIENVKLDSSNNYNNYSDIRPSGRMDTVNYTQITDAQNHTHTQSDITTISSLLSGQNSQSTNKSSETYDHTRRDISSQFEKITPSIPVGIYKRLTGVSDKRSTVQSVGYLFHKKFTRTGAASLEHITGTDVPIKDSKIPAGIGVTFSSNQDVSSTEPSVNTTYLTGRVSMKVDYFGEKLYNKSSVKGVNGKYVSSSGARNNKSVIGKLLNITSQEVTSTIKVLKLNDTVIYMTPHSTSSPRNLGHSSTEITLLSDLLNKATLSSASTKGKYDSRSFERVGDSSLDQERVIANTAPTVAATEADRKHVEFNNASRFIKPNDSSKDWPVDKQQQLVAVEVARDKHTSDFAGESDPLYKDATLLVATKTSAKAGRVSTHGGEERTDKRDTSQPADVPWKRSELSKHSVLNSRTRIVKRYAILRNAGGITERSVDVRRVMKSAQTSKSNINLSIKFKRSSAMAENKAGGYAGPLMMNTSTTQTYDSASAIIFVDNTCSGFGATATVTVIILGVVVLLLLYVVALLVCLPRFKKNTQLRERKKKSTKEIDVEANVGHDIEDCVVAASAGMVAENGDHFIPPEQEHCDENKSDKPKEADEYADEYHPGHEPHTSIHARYEQTGEHDNVVVVAPVYSGNETKDDHCVDIEDVKDTSTPPDDTGFESDVAVEGSDDDRIDISVQSHDDSDEERLNETVILNSPNEPEREIHSHQHEDAIGEHESESLKVPGDVAIAREAGEIEEDFSASMSDGADYSDQDPYPELHGTIPLQPTHYTDEPPLVPTYHDEYPSDEHHVDEHFDEHPYEEHNAEPVIHDDMAHEHVLHNEPVHYEHENDGGIVDPITPDKPYPETYDYAVPDSPPPLPSVPPPAAPDPSNKYHLGDVTYDNPPQHSGREFFDPVNCVEADVHSSPEYVNNEYSNQVYDGENPYAPQYQQAHDAHQ